jgi:hypothetical protein
MSASEVRAKQPLHSNGRPLYRDGTRLAFRQAESLVLLEGTTIADAVELARSQLADLVLIDANNLVEAIEKAKVLVSCCPEMPLVAFANSTASANVVPSSKANASAWWRIARYYATAVSLALPKLTCSSSSRDVDMSFKSKSALNGRSRNRERIMCEL